MGYFHTDYELTTSYHGFSIHWHINGALNGTAVYLEPGKGVTGYRKVTMHKSVAAAKQKARRVLSAIDKAKARNSAWIA